MKKYILIFLLVFPAMAVSFAIGRSGDITTEEEILKLNTSPIRAEVIEDDMQAFSDSASNFIMDGTGTMDSFWEKLLMLRSGEDQTVSIVHIGDSHIQAGFWTGAMRNHMQSEFGNAGRGLILPYKLAGSNEPRDYAITTLYPFASNKATSNDSGEKLGSTGTAITFDEGYFKLQLWHKGGFNSITAFHHPLAPMVHEPDELSPGTYCTIDNTETSTRIILSQSVDTLSLDGFTTLEYKNPTYYGFSLGNGLPGILYHDIGSNGAAFEHFINHTNILSGSLSELCPDLIIVSLGTNNCYGNNFKAENMHKVVERFATQIRAAYPETAILFTTPRESCKRATVKGRRSYVANQNIETAAGVILDVCMENRIATWDYYSAAGGRQTSEKWVANGLASRDRIHLTEKGYNHTAGLMYEALARGYNQWLEGEFNCAGKSEAAAVLTPSSTVN